MKQLLLPFTEHVEMDAITEAVVLASLFKTGLIALSLIRIPGIGQKRKVRLEYIQQSQDFLEAIRHKARRYEIQVQPVELYTHDAARSIHTFAHEMDCTGILLFTSESVPLLLNAGEVQWLMERETLPLFLTQLKTREFRFPWQRWMARRSAQQQTPIPQIISVQNILPTSH
ncbi:MAG: hypothetical protein IMW89_19760 [Ktedonobacteraceae bacterium]|nr:hypothetical protein [Ktedonobacteraceae bacterium]